MLCFPPCSWDALELVLVLDIWSAGDITSRLRFQGHLNYFNQLYQCYPLYLVSVSQLTRKTFQQLNIQDVTRVVKYGSHGPYQDSFTLPENHNSLSLSELDSGSSPFCVHCLVAKFLICDIINVFYSLFILLMSKRELFINNDVICEI